MKGRTLTVLPGVDSARGGDGMFKIRRITAILAILAVVQLMVPFGSVLAGGPTSKIPAAPFLDVYDTKYQDAVGLLYLIKVASGTGAFAFGPNEKVTRAQWAVFVLGMLGEEPASSPSEAFPDVPVSHWANGAITRAVELGLLRGDTTGKFRPEDPVTFAELATVLIRGLGYESQVAPGEWPVQHILLANRLGLLEGSDFSAQTSATRGEMAILLANAVFVVPVAATGKTLNASRFKAVASIKLLPESSVMTTDRLPLSVVGTDWYGNAFPVPGNLLALSSNASVDSSGTLVATGGSEIAVQASYGELSAAQTYYRIKSVSVTPATAVAAVGTTVQFTATGLTFDNKTVPVAVTWSATGPGNIDAKTGLLKVTGGGTITVTTSLGAAAASAQVTGVDSLTVSSNNNILSPGKTAHLSAAGAGGVSVPVTWSIVSGGGSLDAQGLYTAGSPGEVVVQATAGSVTASAKITVVGALRIEPSSAAIGVGTTKQFKAQAQTAAGWQDVPATWTLSNSSIGVLSSTGVLASTASGTGVVTAQYGGLSATASVTVAGQATALRLEASRTIVPANGRSAVTVTATFVDAAGIPTAAPASQVLFSVSSATLGTLSSYSVPVLNNKAEVTFTPGTSATTGNILVASPGTTLTAGTLSITTTAPSVAAIKLSAYPAALAADGVSRTTITATLTDQDGQPITNTTGSALAVNLGASGNAGLLIGSLVSIAPGSSSGTLQFQAAASTGTSTVFGTANYVVQSTQVSTILVGAAAKLGIRTPITETVADGVKQMSVTVELQDANGNVVTSNSTHSVSLTATGPGSIYPGIITLNSGTATFKFSTTKAGTYTFTAADVSNGTIASARATGTFIAGTPTALDIALDPNVNAVSADGVTAVRLTSRVLDAYGNHVTNATTAVTFKQLTINAFEDIGSVTVNALNGVAITSITPKRTPGTDTFVASAPGLTSSTALAVATHITGWANKIVVRPTGINSIVAGQSFQATIWVEDALNQVLTNDSGRTVALALSDGTATSDSPQQTVNGVATFTVTPGKSGTLTIKAQSVGLASDNTGVTMQVTPAVPDHIILTASGTELAADGRSVVTVTPQLVDTYGNTLGTPVTVTLAVNDSNLGRLGSTTINTGYGTTFTASSTPGQVTISGSASYPVTPVVLNTYFAGPPTHVKVDPPKGATAGATGDAAMKVTVRITDDSGHTVSSLTSGQVYGTAGTISIAYLTVVTNSTGTTTLTSTASSPLPPGVSLPSGVTTAGAYIINGQATFTFTDTRAETVTFIPALSLGTTLLTPQNATGTITPGPAASVTVTLAPSAINAQSNTTLFATANLADAYGNAVPSDGDTFNFAVSNNQFLTPIVGWSAASSGSGGTITLRSTPGVTGTAYITASSTKTALTSPATAVVQDYLPAKPWVTVTPLNGTNNFYTSDAAVRIDLSFGARLVSQTATVYVNGVQVTLYSSSIGGSTVSTAAAGTTNLTGYILRSDYGGAGVKSVLAIMTSTVGTGPASDPLTFQVN